MDNELLVKTIRNLCKKNNLPVSQLESELNFGAGLISRWIKSSPSIDKIVDIADYFHISLDEVIGRDINDINNEFIKVLYNKTTNKEIQWESFNTSVDESGIKRYCEDFQLNDFCTCQKEYDDFMLQHKETSYYFEYLHGFISIYAMYSYHNIMNPNELKMFIQPDIEAELIPQSYDTKELLPLWLKILTSLDDKAPDEIKAEDLKQQFITEVKQ